MVDAGGRQQCLTCRDKDARCLKRILQHVQCLSNCSCLVGLHCSLFSSTMLLLQWTGIINDLLRTTFGHMPAPHVFSTVQRKTSPSESENLPLPGFEFYACSSCYLGYSMAGFVFAFSNSRFHQTNSHTPSLAPIVQYLQM